MTAAEKIAQLIKESGLTQKAFAEKAGIRPTTLNSILKNDTKNIKIDNLRGICALCGVTLDYLLDNESRDRDEGRYWGMKLSGPEGRLVTAYRELDAHGQHMVNLVAREEGLRQAQEAAARGRARQAERMRRGMIVHTRPMDGPPTVERVIYDDPAAAGSPNPAQSSHETLCFAKDDVPREAEFGIRIAGDSMEQAVPNGCIAWIEPKTELFNNQIGIFGLEDGFVCKRAKVNAQGKIIALESDNPQYADIEGEALWGMRIIGEVVGTYCEE